MRAERDDFFGRERLFSFQLAVKFLPQAREHFQVVRRNIGAKVKSIGIGVLVSE
jgi:hypothetical protein